MKQILIDTSVLIDYLRKKDKEESQLVQILKQGARVAISLITHTELYSGKSVWSNPHARRQLDEILETFTILPFTSDLSYAAGHLRAKHDIALEDAIIAATALDDNLPLATLNTKDFKRIKGLKLV